MAVNQYPLARLYLPDNDEHLRIVSVYLNNTISGKLNSTGTVTLTASSTTSTLSDARIGVNSVIFFMPTTANAATAKANLYVSARGDGTATLTHASSANSDQNFAYIIIG